MVWQAPSWRAGMDPGRVQRIARYASAGTIAPRPVRNRQLVSRTNRGSRGRNGGTCGVPAEAGRTLAADRVSRLTPWPGAARRLIGVGDLDEVRWLVKVRRVLPPPARVERENRADRRVGDRGHMSVPRVEPGPGDHRGQPDGLLGVPQGARSSRSRAARGRAGWPPCHPTAGPATRRQWPGQGSPGAARRRPAPG